MESYKDLLKLSNEVLLEKYVNTLKEIQEINEKIEQISEQLDELKMKHTSLSIHYKYTKMLKEGNLSEEKKAAIEETVKDGKELFGTTDLNEIEKMIKQTENEYDKKQKEIYELENKRKELSELIEILRFVALLK